MDIICPNCKLKRTIDINKIPKKKVMVHCKSCQHRFPLELREARRLGVMISKGGAGKTTTSVNLAHGIALAGKKVLLVDTDTQGQCAYMLGAKPKAGLAELVTGELGVEECLHQARENLWLLAGGKSLAGVKRLIDRKDFGGEMTLSESLAPLQYQFDYIVVDTSPGWDPMTVTVLFYVKELLIPVSLEVMSVQGLSEFLKSFASIRKYHKNVSIQYILPTFMDKRNKNCEEILEKLETLYGKYLCSPIRYSVRLSEAPAYGMSIYEYAGGDQVVQDFKELVQDVIKSHDEE